MSALLARSWCAAIVVIASCGWTLLPGADAGRPAFVSSPSLRASTIPRSRSSGGGGGSSSSSSYASSAGTSRRGVGARAMSGSAGSRRSSAARTGRAASASATKMSVSLWRRRYYPRWGRQPQQHQQQNQQQREGRNLNGPASESKGSASAPSAA
ncbi:unnamed protein product, partial [Scytosiphon promiscuus]